VGCLGGEDVRRYTDAEIRKVMALHYPVGDVEYYDNGAEAFCNCGQSMPPLEELVKMDSAWHPKYISFTADHLLTQLEALRR
jgi:hypothetical protein